MFDDSVGSVSDEQQQDAAPGGQLQAGSNSNIDAGGQSAYQRTRESSGVKDGGFRCWAVSFSTLLKQDANEM
jgi:hypothetical protein